MVKHLQLKLMFLLCAIVAGSGTMWSQSDYSATETSNVTLTAGTNGSACTVNGYNGIKVGTSKKGGDMSVTVPAGTTHLHVHAAAWNGVTDLSLNISGATVDPTSIALTADTEIANISPFTLSGDASDFYFIIELSDITTETTLTFETSTAKRFVIWGVNAEEVVTGPVDVTLSFANSTPSVSLTKGDGTFDGSFEQAVSASPANYNGTISYSIDVSNSTIPSGWLVEVSNEGEVTIVADTNEGATIKVKASGTAVTDKFNAPADATYTLTVNAYKPDAPTFSVAAGAVDYGTSLTLTAAEGTTIRYTLDEDDPTASTGEVYSTPIAIKNNGTVKAIAIDGSFVSEVVSAAYTINTPANVTLSPAGGASNNKTSVQYGTQVTMTHSMAPAMGTIRYTTNGTIPANQIGDHPDKVFEYSEPITITSDCRIKPQFQTDNGVFWSASAPDNYYTVATPAAPTASEASGEVAINTTVTLSHALLTNNLGKIYYTVTTDGSEPAEPTAESTEYTNGITIDADKKIKARFITNGGHLGEIATFEYTYTRTAAGLAYATSSYEVPVNSSFATPELTNPHGLTIAYTSTNTDIAEVNAQTGAITIKAVEGTTTIYARSERDATYYAGEASYTITVYDPTVPGTQWVPYTVEQALAVINAMENGATTTEEFFVRGIVAGANSVNNYRQQYELSDNGLTGTTLRVYKGKAEGNVNMTENNKVNVGDVVVVKGKFMKYVNNQNVIPEVAQDNYIFSINRRTAPGMSYSPATYSSHPNDADFVTPTMSNPNNLSGFEFASSDTDVASVDAATGEVTIGSVEGTATITVTYPGPIDSDYKRGTATYTINSARSEAGFSFSSASVTLQLEETFTAPTFSNPNSLTNITFNSDNTDVATVDAQGVITCNVNLLGTAVITATSPQTDEYNAGSSTFTINVERKDATLNVSDDITSMDVTTEMEVNTLYTTNSDGTVTLTSSAPAVAAIEDGKLKAQTLGTATITVSVAQSDTYKGASNTFTVTVTSKDAVLPAGPIGGNGYVLVTDASTLSAGDQVIIVSSKSNGTGNAMSTTQNENNRGITEVTISGEAIASVSNSVQNLTLEGNATDGWYFNTGSGYLYAASSNKNYLRTETTADANAKATISISNGAATITFQGTNKRNLLQYNNSNSIFSCYSSGQDDVYLYRLNTASTYDITTNASGWKTLVSSVNVSLPAGLKAYKVTGVTASSVTLEEVSAVKKNVPVIIHGTASTEYTLTIVDDDDSNLDDNSDNLLQISTNTTGNGVYVLATKNNNTGWYKWAGGSLGAGRVYLPASALPSNAREFLSFDYDATGISNIDANLNLDGRVYDLQGRPVAQPQKGGLYIVNGRKVVVK